MSDQLTIEDCARLVSVLGPDEKGLRLLMDGALLSAAIDALGDGRMSMEVNGLRHEAVFAVHGETVWLHAFGRAWRVDAVDAIGAAKAAADGGGGGSDALRAPMPGVVTMVKIASGQRVAKGDTLLVIESMKLQTTLVADRDGVVEAVFFEEGAAFDKGAVLLRLGAENG